MQKAHDWRWADRPLAEVKDILPTPFTAPSDTSHRQKLMQTTTSISPAKPLRSSLAWTTRPSWIPERFNFLTNESRTSAMPRPWNSARILLTKNPQLAEWCRTSKLKLMAADWTFFIYGSPNRIMSVSQYVFVSFLRHLRFLNLIWYVKQGLKNEPRLRIH